MSCLQCLKSMESSQWYDSTVVVFMVLDGNTSYQERIADTIFWCHLKIREVDKEDDLCACHKLTETSATAIQPDQRWHQFMTLPEYLPRQDGRGAQNKCYQNQCCHLRSFKSLKLKQQSFSTTSNIDRQLSCQKIGQKISEMKTNIF